MDIVMMWLSAGAALIIFEAVTAPGLGIFLAGLGALCTALVIQLGLTTEQNTVAQFAWFFAFTIAWAAVLWKPLKNFRSASRNKTSPEDKKEHSDIVGSIAVVGKQGIRRGEAGHALWSGTIMTAMLDDKSPVDFIAEGTQVKVHSVNGTTLVVQPVH